MRLIDVESIHFSDSIEIDGEKNNFILEADLEKEPTVNAMLIAHAYWKEKQSIVCICSQCGYTSLVEGHYCPHCGCKMDEDKKCQIL